MSCMLVYVCSAVRRVQTLDNSSIVLACYCPLVSVFFHDIMTLDIVFTLFRELGVNDLRKNCTLYIASFSELYRVLTSTTETGDKLYVLSSFIISSVEILGKP